MNALENVTELAWAAGFFDGEGCIHLTERNRKGSVDHELRLVIAQVVEKPILKFKEILGGRVRVRSETSKGNVVYEWSCSSKESFEILKKLRPYLVLKDEQADTALSFEQLYVGKGKRNTLTKNNIENRSAIAKTLKELKQKGKNKS